jgi:hypothetical protein
MKKTNRKRNPRRGAAEKTEGNFHTVIRVTSAAKDPAEENRISRQSK